MSNEPRYNAATFTCPACAALTGHEWLAGGLAYGIGGPHSRGAVIAVCMACKAPSVWTGVVHGTGNAFTAPAFASVVLDPSATMVFPYGLAGPAANADLPTDARADYEEARSIVGLSPRGAAALLRLVLQKVCIHLGEPGRNLNDDIAALVKKQGLRTETQRALDVLRVIGNNAVHPGELDLGDDTGTALALFEMVNIVVDQLISQPARIAELYSRLPQGARDAIDRRDDT